MPPFEGLTGPISFDANGKRTNYTIDIYRSSFNMPLTKVCIFKIIHNFKSYIKV